MTTCVGAPRLILRTLQFICTELCVAMSMLPPVSDSKSPMATQEVPERLKTFQELLRRDQVLQKTACSLFILILATSPSP